RRVAVVRDEVVELEELAGMAVWRGQLDVAQCRCAERVHVRGVAGYPKAAVVVVAGRAVTQSRPDLSQRDVVELPVRQERSRVALGARELEEQLGTVALKP